ncbi:Ankyrin domain-containing protein [Fasciola gigantica]|uniref:Ankyrin domain-containing protein n=1 Tax=Fasciola gigantica TaxID=46835 RepID=A0A504Z9N2_FASGI|nr:Ankyrin domain-containing protein [Fasciola gigantica]
MVEVDEQDRGSIQQPDGSVPWGFPDELDLCDATKFGDLRRVSKHIGNGVNVNFLDGFGRAPLHYAAQSGFVKQEIDSGLCSILDGDFEAVKLLVANKARTNIFDANHVTPLHLAAKGNHKLVVKFLVMTGGDVNLESVSGCKPVDFAPYGSETWQVLINAAQGQLPHVEHLVQTRTVPMVPQFAIKREVDKQAAKADKSKGKKKGKGKKGGKKSGKMKRK